jgi:Secretion system C-terminal sorting domain
MPMKRLQLPLFLLFFGVNLFAQTQFMPIGSTLQSRYSVFIGAGKAVFSAEKDTFINAGLSVRKILITRKDKRTNEIFTENLYLHQRGDSIFEYSESTRKLYFLFKNRYVVGDSFRLQDTFNNVVTTRATIYIDSVIQKNNVKRYAVRMKIPPRFSELESFLRFNMYDKFLPDYHWSLATISILGFYDGFIYLPNCYSDNNTVYQTAYFDAQICNLPTEITGVSDLESDIGLTFSPNPANAYWAIESHLNQTFELDIYTTNGKLVFSKTITTPANMPIHDLSNGLYIVKIKDRKGLVVNRKLMVQR